MQVKEKAHGAELFSACCAHRRDAADKARVKRGQRPAKKKAEH
jgi:hypothetical protein